MTILGSGDLSPRRSHAPVGRYITIALVVLLLGGGGYAAYAGLTGGSSDKPTARQTLPKCAKPSTTSLFAPPGKVRLVVYNASLRTGLAAEVQTALEHRGFHVTQIGNALKVGRYVAAISYSKDEGRQSRTVAAQIPGEADIVPVSGRHVLELDLGVNFAHLQSVRAARAVEQRLVDSHSSSPSPSPTCQAQ